MAVVARSGRSIRNKRVVWGTVTLDGANPTGVDLTRELSAIESFQLSHEANATPGNDPTYLTGKVNGLTLEVYAWKTDGIGPTLIASTNAAVVVHYMAVGAA